MLVLCTLLDAAADSVAESTSWCTSVTHTITAERCCYKHSGQLQVAQPSVLCISSYLLLLLLPRSAVRATVVALPSSYLHSLFVCTCGQVAREAKTGANFGVFLGRYVPVHGVLMSNSSSR